MKDSKARIDWSSAKPTLVLGGVWAAPPAIAGFVLIARLDLAAQWLGALGTSAIVVYAVFFAITSGLGLLPTYAQALAGGWIFGLGSGTVAALAGFTGGAIIGRLACTGIASGGLDGVFAQDKKADAVRTALLGRGMLATTGIITLLRVPPNSPFALTNLALTACRAKWIPYIIGTAIGMSPRTAIVVGFGAAGASTGASSLGDMLAHGTHRWYLVGGIIVLMIVLVILARIGQLAIAKVHAAHQPAN